MVKSCLAKYDEMISKKQECITTVNQRSMFLDSDNCFYSSDFNTVNINEAASDICLTIDLKKAASIARRSLAPGKPHHAQWLVTRKCNYRCAGCNVWKEQDQRELATDFYGNNSDHYSDIISIQNILFVLEY